MQPNAILLVDKDSNVDQERRDRLAKLGRLMVTDEATETERVFATNADIIRIVIVAQGSEGIVGIKKMIDQGPRYLICLRACKVVEPAEGEKKPKPKTHTYGCHALVPANADDEVFISKVKEMWELQDGALARSKDQSWYRLDKILEGVEGIMKTGRLETLEALKSSSNGFSSLSRQAQSWVDSVNLKQYEQQLFGAAINFIGAEHLPRYFDALRGADPFTLVPLFDAAMDRLINDISQNPDNYEVTDFECDRWLLLLIIKGKIVKVRFELEDMLNASHDQDSLDLRSRLIIGCRDNTITTGLLTCIQNFVKQLDIESLTLEASAGLRESKHSDRFIKSVLDFYFPRQ